MDLQTIDATTVLLAAGAALTLVIIITLGIKIAGCIFTLMLIFLPAAIAGVTQQRQRAAAPAAVQ